MNRIFSTMFASIRAKFLGFWMKVQLLTKRAYWETKGIVAIKRFFSKIFNIRPKNKTDYYPIFRWLVSKRLAFALIFCLGLVSVFYIFIMSPVVSSIDSKSTPQIRTYKYNSLPLKFYNGQVKILAAGGYVAYVGEVGDGAAVGKGSLYRPDGSLLYEGQFDSSMYNGAGNLYFPDGTLAYQGDFVNNVYQGQGSLYRQSGTLEYVGAFLSGMKSGGGTLYNSGGNPIFTGNFLADHLIFSEFLGKTTTETSSMYTGRTGIYSSNDEYCVSMDEINAVYAAEDGSNSLTSDWQVGSVLVLEDKFPVPGKSLSTINELTGYFGTPDYFGETWPTLLEAVGISKLSETGGAAFAPMEITASETFDQVYHVSAYDKDYELYIYVYKADGLVYTFYCDSSTSNFSMYAVSQDLSQEDPAQAPNP